MPFYVKDSGSFSAAFSQGDVSVKQSGSWVTVNQLYIKDSGIWVPMWSTIPALRYGYDSTFTDLTSLNNTQLGTFATTYITNSLSNNDTPQTPTFNDSGTNYLYLMWPSELGDIQMTDPNTSFSLEFWGQGETYDGEIFEFSADPGPISFTFDDGSGSRGWYLRRSDFKGSYNPGDIQIDGFA